MVRLCGTLASLVSLVPVFGQEQVDEKGHFSEDYGRIEPTHRYEESNEALEFYTAQCGILVSNRVIGCVKSL